MAQLRNCSPAHDLRDDHCHKIQKSLSEFPWEASGECVHHCSQRRECKSVLKIFTRVMETFLRVPGLMLRRFLDIFHNFGQLVDGFAGIVVAHQSSIAL